ncbi:MAG: outer membrane beta-barrel protein [bacterium]
MSLLRKVCLFGFLLLVVQSSPGQELVGPHGFLTLESEYSNKDSVGRRGTFDLHHFNLLGSYLLNAKARVFGEIEFEHGTDSEADETGGTKAGFIVLERAWFEYSFSKKLKLRLGKFLTPYGIYNEIHDAAPAFDTSILPNSIYGKHQNPFGHEQIIYAKFSIGVQALGEFELHSTRLQYQLFLTNGRGKDSFEQDDNKNKGIGFRFKTEVPALGLNAGTSFYTDKNGLANDTRQTSWAGDVRFEFNRWLFSAEFAHSTLDTKNIARGDQIANAGYVELAYQLLDRQTVLVRYDVFDPDHGLSGDMERDLTIGTNRQILKQALVKAEVHFWNVDSATRQNYFLAITSLAVVF